MVIKIILYSIKPQNEDTTQKFIFRIPSQKQLYNNLINKEL